MLSLWHIWKSIAIVQVTYNCHMHSACAMASVHRLISPHTLTSFSSIMLLPSTYHHHCQRLSSTVKSETVHQHNIGYTADGFYRSKEQTNSIKVLHGTYLYLLDNLFSKRADLCWALYYHVDRTLISVHHTQMICCTYGSIGLDWAVFYVSANTV